jgi:sugar O-acyltransferase (sialic acid O-acetyltransferase NeuD family)
MGRDIVIVGASGFAREIAWLIAEINEQEPTWNLIGHVDADARQIGTQIGDSVVIGDDTFLLDRRRDLHVAIGIGHPRLISRLSASLLSAAHLSFPNLIHPSVRRDMRRMALGQGNLLCAGTLFTTGIAIGSFNVFNLASTIGHDVSIGDCCVINPGCNISGGVRIEDRCLLGTGSQVLQNITIGAGATVGGGALVHRNVPAGVTVVGVPAKPVVKS